MPCKTSAFSARMGYDIAMLGVRRHAPKPYAD